ncbi:MAG: RnfABCDGE type electron transport complex subunit G [Firmicutes bacterium]|nr:RnfABCDGE type electron transport complex subunit G [Bacillota bacterium]
MQSPVRLGVTLMIICIVAAGLLAFTNAKTEPIIAEHEQTELQTALKELLPMADTFEPVSEGEKVFYRAQKGNKDVGVVAVFSQKGFGGVMKLALGVDTEGKVTGFKVLQHSETPGLGARITETNFTDQFVGKSTTDDFQVGKDVQAISGATISSRSVAGGIKLIASEINKQLSPHDEDTLNLNQIPDGVYEGQAGGFGGDIKVKVTITGGQVVDIQVVEDSETPDIGGRALPKISEKIISAQDVNVDNVSGATYSSEGLKAAVTDALSKAKGE